MQYARLAAVYRRRRASGVDAAAARFGKHYAHAAVVDIVIHRTGSVGASANARHETVGIVTSLLLLQLPLYFFRYYALHACHYVGIRMRSHCRADDIKRVRRMTAPVAYSLRTGIAKRHVSCRHRMHLRTEHAHAFHIGVLPLHIGLAHKHLALHTHQRTHRGCCHPVLSGTRLRYYTTLAHLARQQYLPYGIVYLVRTGMVKVLTLQI